MLAHTAFDTDHADLSLISASTFGKVHKSVTQTRLDRSIEKRGRQSSTLSFTTVVLVVEKQRH